MEYRTIITVYPDWHVSNAVNLCSSKVPFKPEMTIYNSVEYYEKNIHLKTTPRNELVKKEKKIGNIINMHNSDGIKDINQIKSMIEHIKSGKDVLSESGMPNIKLVKTRNNELVLFDGHHTMLAYMAIGKEHLHEMPHLFVYNEDDKEMSDQEIHAFFCEHAKEIEGKEWRDYVINWQNEKDKQVCKRIDNNMQELFQSLKNSNNL